MEKILSPRRIETFWHEVSTEIFSEVFHMENSSSQQELQAQTISEREKIYLTSENSPKLKEAMDKISAKLLERNKNLYRRLANAC